MNFETSNITTQDYFKFFICFFLIFFFTLFLYFNPNIFESKYYIYIYLYSFFVLFLLAHLFIYVISKSTIMFVLLGFMMLIFYYYAYKFFESLDLVNSGMYILCHKYY